jgi:hypothetical protein
MSQNFAYYVINCYHKNLATIVKMQVTLSKHALTEIFQGV